MKGISKFLLKILGWKTVGGVAPENKCIIVGAPHTSLWDFVISWLYYSSLGGTANILIKKEIISIGILDKSIVHPREIFGPAVELHAAGIILLHNHPSGNVNPSDNDTEVVNKIIEAGQLMGINVIDFLIITNKE